MKRKRIAWIADFVVKTYKAGGAQYSNEMFINAGLKRGYSIDIITKDDTLDKEYDLYILNNIRFFEPDFLNDIIDNKPFMRLEHDYWICGGCLIYPNILNNSLLNVFMSARHLAEVERLKHMRIPKSEYVASPIDTDLFCIDKRVKKDKNLVVWTGHDKPENKGFATAIQYAESKPNFKFKMFGIFKEKHTLPGNVEIIGEVEQPVFAKWLKKAQYLMAVPKWIEPSGRSVLEGILCGCDLIVNNNIGALGADIDFNDYEQVVRLAHSEDKFWGLIEKLDF